MLSTVVLIVAALAATGLLAALALRPRSGLGR